MSEAKIIITDKWFEVVISLVVIFVGYTLKDISENISTMSKEMSSINSKMAVVISEGKVRQKGIEDHEARIRTLEKNR